MDQPNRPKLLLADDSVTIRKVVELTFADEGIDVTTVGDSAAAMTRFVEIQPDIVLVDAGLDGTSGYQICEMIKSDEATRHIPVLLLIGSFEPFDQDEAERVQADGFLTKPFHSIRDLVARVWELLGHETATAQAAQAAPAVVDAFGAEHESLEHISSDLKAIPASNEDDDIDELYRSSFAETVEIDEYDTVDDMLGDSALDDEMIEASYPTEAYTNDLNGLIPDAETVTDLKEGSVEDTKEFDWSPAAVVSAPLETPPAAFEPKFVFDETGDEAPDAIAETADESAKALPETSQFERTLDDEDLGLEALIGTTAATEPEAVTEEPEEVATAAAEAVAEEPHAETVPEESQAQTSEPEIWPEVGNAPDEYAARQMVAITPEMLDIIAEKVVARLSDSVIREVALEAVPRIAEKLIREALSDTGRSNENKEAIETSA